MGRWGVLLFSITGSVSVCVAFFACWDKKIPKLDSYKIRLIEHREQQSAWAFAAQRLRPRFPDVALWTIAATANKMPLTSVLTASSTAGVLAAVLEARERPERRRSLAEGVLLSCDDLMRQSLLRGSTQAARSFSDSVGKPPDPRCAVVTGTFFLFRCGSRSRL